MGSTEWRRGTGLRAVAGVPMGLNRKAAICKKAKVWGVRVLREFFADPVGGQIWTMTVGTSI